MTNYLDQLREQIRLKQMGAPAPRKQPQSGLPRLLDYINPESKKA